MRLLSSPNGIRTPMAIFAEGPRDPHPFVENVTDFIAFLRKGGGFEI